MPSNPDELRQKIEKIHKMLNTLTPEEEQIFCLRFGLRGNAAHTVEEVAEVCQISCERVQQIEAEAKQKLRHPKRSSVVLDNEEIDTPEETTNASDISGERIQDTEARAFELLRNPSRSRLLRRFLED